MTWIFRLLAGFASFVGRYLGNMPRSPFEGILFDTTRTLTREYQRRLLSA